MSIPVVGAAAERVRAVLPGVTVYEGEATERVEGTGAPFVEVRYGGPWGPTPNSARHVVVVVNIYADVTRDEMRLPTADDADRRAWILWESVDAVLHDMGHRWAQVHSSRRADGPVLLMVPEGDGSVLLSARYEVSANH